MPRLLVVLLSVALVSPALGGGRRPSRLPAQHPVAATAGQRGPGVRHVVRRSGQPVVRPTIRIAAPAKRHDDQGEDAWRPLPAIKVARQAGLYVPEPK